MAAESDTGFSQGRILAPAATLNGHAISFEAGTVSSSSEIIPVGNYFGINGSVPTVFSGNTDIITNYPAITQANNSSSSLLFDSVPLNHDNGLLADWSVEEQYKLEEGLARLANEPSITKYIKIAATLQDKTVRDVALRWRWMTKKRRKLEECNTRKRIKDRKACDNLMEAFSTSKTNAPSVSLQNMSPYAYSVHHIDQNGRAAFEGSGTAKHLLEQNTYVFDRVVTNFLTYKLTENIDLFCQTRNNINAILKDMNVMPGIMSQMPPLPVCINDDLANSILPHAAQVAMPYGLQPRIHIKHEPRC